MSFILPEGTPPIVQNDNHKPEWPGKTLDPDMGTARWNGLSACITWSLRDFTRLMHSFGIPFCLCVLDDREDFAVLTSLHHHSQHPCWNERFYDGKPPFPSIPPDEIARLMASRLERHLRLMVDAEDKKAMAKDVTS